MLTLEQVISILTLLTQNILVLSKTAPLTAGGTGLGLGAKDGGDGFECSAFPRIISCYKQGK